jgi:cation diffusion facilitator family transporter
MKHFPKPIPLPTSVNSARSERKSHVLKAMRIGILIRSCIIFGEILGVVIFGSRALLMDALASTLDVVSSLFLIFFIKLAERPPDRNHPFGHGRFEPLAGLQLGLLLVLVGLGMFIYEFLLIGIAEKRQIHVYTWILPLVAVILLEICYFISKYVAKKHHSAALLSESYHFRIDSLTSFFAMLALLGGSFFPNYSVLIDNLGAMIIAIVMIVLGIMAMKSNIHQLLDRVPDEKYFKRIIHAAKKVKGVKETEKIRVQLYGPDAHVSIDVEVEPQLSVEKAHSISQAVRAEIQKEWPAVRDVIVHIEPYYPGDH